MVRVVPGLRLLAALLAVAGLGLTLGAAPLASRPVVDKAGYRVVAVDFHVHSFPGDGLLPPWEIAIEARRRRLDAVALTNHNSTHSWRLARWLSRVTPHGGAMLIPGQELTAVGFHLAVAGVTMPIDWRQSAASAAAAVHARGGVAIAAHPAHETWRFLDEAALAALDGVEVAHPMILIREKRRDLTAFYQHALRVDPTIAAIGSSDFHHFAPIGLGRTYVFAREATADGILDAVRSGRTVACDGVGISYGPPVLVPLVKDDCVQDQASPPDGETARDRVGTCLVWLGLLGLVVLGPREVS
jgi:predicted metal-dependent phosphoesterase TrpH